MTRTTLRASLLAALAGCVTENEIVPPVTVGEPSFLPSEDPSTEPAAAPVDIREGTLTVAESPEIWGRLRVAMADLPVGEEVMVITGTRPGQGVVDGIPVDVEDPRILARFVPDSPTRYARGRHGTDALIGEKVHVQAIASDGTWRTPLVSADTVQFPPACFESTMGYAYVGPPSPLEVHGVTVCDTNAVPGMCADQLDFDGTSFLDAVVPALSGQDFIAWPLCRETDAIASCCYTYAVEGTLTPPPIDTGGGAGWGGGWGGRPLVVDHEVRVAEACLTGAAVEAGDCPDALRDDVVRGWIRTGLEEHASIGAFARFSLELLEHGAPMDLVLDAAQAQREEVEHAQLAFSIASHYAGQRIEPEGLPTQGLEPRTLREVVLDTVREGCLNETISALEAMSRRDLALQPRVREALSKISDDEARHSELSWRFVRWALSRPDTDDLRVEVLAELRAFRPPTVRTAAPIPLEAFGLSTAHRRAECEARAFVLIQECTDALEASFA